MHWKIQQDGLDNTLCRVIWSPICDTYHDTNQFLSKSIDILFILSNFLCFSIYEPILISFLLKSICVTPSSKSLYIAYHVIRTIMVKACRSKNFYDKSIWSWFVCVFLYVIYCFLYITNWYLFFFFLFFSFCVQFLHLRPYNHAYSQWSQKVIWLIPFLWEVINCMVSGDIWGHRFSYGAFWRVYSGSSNELG